MNDINQIAGQLQQNTAKQGQELIRTDQNMEVVKDNVVEAHKEIVEAQEH